MITNTGNMFCTHLLQLNDLTHALEGHGHLEAQHLDAQQLEQVVRGVQIHPVQLDPPLPRPLPHLVPHGHTGRSIPRRTATAEFLPQVGTREACQLPAGGGQL